MVTPAAREWVTFPDPKRKRHVWHFDVTYLTSAHMPMASTEVVARIGLSVLGVQTVSAVQQLVVFQMPPPTTAI